MFHPIGCVFGTKLDRLKFTQEANAGGDLPKASSRCTCRRAFDITKSSFGAGFDCYRDFRMNAWAYHTFPDYEWRSLDLQPPPCGVDDILDDDCLFFVAGQRMFLLGYDTRHPGLNEQRVWNTPLDLADYRVDVGKLANPVEGQ
jgi:hypothetical protein